MQIRIWILGFFSIIVIKELYLLSRMPEDRGKISFSLYLATALLLTEVFVFYNNVTRIIISSLF